MGRQLKCRAVVDWLREGESGLQLFWGRMVRRALVALAPNVSGHRYTAVVVVYTGVGSGDETGVCSASSTDSPYTTADRTAGDLRR